MKRYGSREICNVVLKNITTGEPVLYLETLKVSSLDMGATEVSAKGSRGNPKLITWSSDKEATFKCEDALISPESLALLAGTTVSTGDISAHKKESFVIGTTTGATTTGITSLAEIPTTGSVGTGIFIYIASNSYSVTTAITWSTAGTGENCYTFTGTHIAFGTGTVTGGDYCIVDYYTTVTGAKRITISSDQFGSYYKLEAETLWKGETDGEDYPALYTMPKVKLKDTWSIAME
jgi:hypothetical protein